MDLSLGGKEVHEGGEGKTKFIRGREQCITGMGKGSFDRPGILGGYSLEGEGHWNHLPLEEGLLWNPLLCGIEGGVL